MAVRRTLGVLLLLTLGWAGWTLLNARRGEAAPRTGRVAERQHELLKLNIDQPADPDLAAIYAGINAKHFGGALPPTPVRWEPRLSEIGALASGAFTLEGMFGHIGKRTA